MSVKKIINKCRRKDRADVSACVFILIGMVFLLITLALGMSYLHAIEKSGNSEMVIHTYMLEMEAEGGLTPEIVSSLKADLDAIGIDSSTIQITGTYKPTDGSSNYGTKLTLDVRGKLKAAIINADGLKDKEYDVHYTKVGTSKFIGE